MPDPSRITELRHRLDKDPGSIAFAQLAEELRRDGQYEEAVEICRAGLISYPKYASARVTLARALIGLGQIRDARVELEETLRIAPDNLAATRALAEIQDRKDIDTIEDGTVDSRASTVDSHQSTDDNLEGLISDAAVRKAEQDGGLEALQTLTVLESWLDAINVARARRSA